MNKDFGVKIAYLVLAHEDPLQLKALVSELATYSDVYVHINKLSDIKPFIDSIKDIDNRDRVIFINKRYKVHWGGYSIVKATFELLSEALKRNSYDRVILLTGLDYPIMSGAAISQFFSSNDTNYLHSQELNGEKHSFLKHRYYYDNKLLKIFSFALRKSFPESFIIRRKNDYVEYNGERYTIYGVTPKWAITGECASYLLDFYLNNPSFNDNFKSMHAPDDFYVATVLHHSHFRESISHENIFFMHRLPDNKGAKILDISDMPTLLENTGGGGGMCLQKKFHSGVSDSLIEALHEKWENE